MTATNKIDPEMPNAYLAGKNDKWELVKDRTDVNFVAFNQNDALPHSLEGRKFLVKQEFIGLVAQCKFLVAYLDTPSYAAITEIATASVLFKRCYVIVKGTGSKMIDAYWFVCLLPAANVYQVKDMSEAKVSINTILDELVAEINEIDNKPPTSKQLSTLRWFGHAGPDRQPEKRRRG